MKDLSMHILDIIQNSVRAEASEVELEIVEELEKNLYTIIINDNGCGMDEKTLEMVIDPFFTTRTTRKVGLGLPLIKQNAERTGGYLDIDSELGKGTKIKAVFTHDNLDRPSLGDIAGTVVLLVGANPEIRFNYVHKTDDGEFLFDTKEVKEALEGVPINNAEILMYLRDMIKENLQAINVD